MSTRKALAELSSNTTVSSNNRSRLDESDSKKAKTLAKQDIKRRLTNMDFSDDFSDEITHEFNMETAQELIKILESTILVSEEDPLLIVCLDTNDINSIGYFNDGNYGIANDYPGYLNWPDGNRPPPGGSLPHGVFNVGPRGFGAYLNSFNGVQDLSQGMLTIFKIANVEILNSLHVQVQNHSQYIRKGPIVAGLLNIPVEPALLKFYTLEKLAGPANNKFGFNQTV